MRDFTINQAVDLYFKIAVSVAALVSTGLFAVLVSVITRPVQ